ncbi:MAG: AMP-binding protein [Alcaligenaceae bacterium]|nr:AMP-binding protein [Alcaligenaceae bacterium]
MLNQKPDYAQTYRDFEWQIPRHYNIGVDVCDKWADGSGRLALIDEKSPDNISRYTFDQLKEYSNQFARVLQKAGVGKGDRVGILLAQGVETAIAHIAVYKLGAIAVPLFSLFGVDALQHRLSNSGARALVTNHEGMEKLADIQESLPQLQAVFNIDLAESSSTALDFWSSLRQEAPSFTALNTLAEDPAVIIYTSGTTGKPKGALHAHRVLPGHLPGVEMSHDFLPVQGSVMWTPADWAWIGGLFDVLMPAWHHGIPVVACRFAKFTAQAAFELMERHQVTHTFLPPTALKMMRHIENPRQQWNLNLRSIASGGESLGLELIEWGRHHLGITINEFYGQTECNMIVSSCAALFEPDIGSIGKAVPGHKLAIINKLGNPVPNGQEGNIAVLAPDPVMFLRYWKNPEATKEKFTGSWLLTGDMGVCDEAGFIRFVGRDDDVITSAGYRIGPGPIEDCILGHPAVSMVAVVGLPDKERTEVVAAFVVLHDGVSESEALKQEIQAHVRHRVAAHEYPRQIYFVRELPMTTTGKIIRKALRQQEL